MTLSLQDPPSPPLMVYKPITKVMTQRSLSGEIQSLLQKKMAFFRKGSTGLYTLSGIGRTCVGVDFED
ncbi:hypothetical protein DLS43_13975 [Staphylococcus pseudintermedius]|nr:hypothetical protein DLS43_13975 [Staphylococcus pseudintermedius]